MIAVGILVGLAMGLGGCAKTTRIGDGITPKRLAVAGKAVAVMRVGAASPNCLHVAVLLAVRHGAAYRPATWLKVFNVKSPSEPAVAEAVLAPGEYHVVAYQCATAKSVKSVDSKADAQTYTTSYAHFRLAAGEVVNVGYLHFHARRIGKNAFGRPVKVTVSISDWPIADLERYKAARPQIYQQMKTRLMTAGAAAGGADMGSDTCARVAALKAAGKLQSVPQRCAAAGARASARYPAGIDWPQGARRISRRCQTFLAPCDQRNSKRRRNQRV